MTTELTPQTRAARESAEAWAAYLAFRDLGPTRTLAAAYRAHLAQQNEQSGPNRPEKVLFLPPSVPGSWKRWRAQFDWDGRVHAYDRQTETAVQAARTTAIQSHAHDWAARRVEQKEADWRLSVALRQKAEQMLGRLDLDAEDADISVGALTKLVETATKLGRLAAGMETDRTGTLPVPALPEDLSQLTDEELEELERAHRPVSG